MNTELKVKASEFARERGNLHRCSPDGFHSSWGRLHRPPAEAGGREGGELVRRQFGEAATAVKLWTFGCLQSTAYLPHDYPSGCRYHPTLTDSGRVVSFASKRLSQPASGRHTDALSRDDGTVVVRVGSFARVCVSSSGSRCVTVATGVHSIRSCSRLHNNASELQARVSARRRDVSLHSRSLPGVRAMDIFTTLVQTSKKLGTSAYAYLRDRLRKRFELTSLPETIRSAVEDANLQAASR